MRPYAWLSFLQERTHKGSLDYAAKLCKTALHKAAEARLLSGRCLLVPNQKGCVNQLLLLPYQPYQYVQVLPNATNEEVDAFFVSRYEAAQCLSDGVSCLQLGRCQQAQDSQLVHVTTNLHSELLLLITSLFIT